MSDVDNLKVLPANRELKILTEPMRQKLVIEVAALINRFSLENCVDMPDFIIAQHMVDSFENLTDTVQKHRRWINQ
jgi:hypothetical protein